MRAAVGRPDLGHHEVASVVQNGRPRQDPGIGKNDMAEQVAGRVLIVDDDPFFLRVLSRILGGENFQVTTAEGVTEARNILQEIAFDVVISDLRLPDGDGLGILQEIRQGGSTVPVVILTAYGEVDSYLEAMNAGAAEYLNKPVNSEELVALVRNCLSRRVASRKVAS